MANVACYTIGENETYAVNADYATAARGPTAITTTGAARAPSTKTTVGALNHFSSIAASSTAYAAYHLDKPGDDWFEKFHLLPRSITLGNILSNIATTITLFSAFRRDTHVLSSFVNNTGAGSSITNLPSLPYVFPALTGISLNYLVVPEGDPEIDGTLDFVFDIETDSLPVTGTRIVMFPFEPETPLVEHLEFLTTVLEHKDGTEQRVSMRVAPRQSFDLVLRREDDGVHRSKVDNLLFDWQAKVFGVPVWIEPSFLTSAASMGQTSVSVDDTTLADYRVGGLAIIYQDESTYDAVVITSLGSNVINFQTGLSNSYATATRVMPLRTAICKVAPSEKRYANNLADISLTMCIKECDVSLADTSAWNAYNGKVLLDGGNIIDDSLDGTLNRQITIFDGDTGVFSGQSTWATNRRSSAKSFFCRTRTVLWNIRKLLHALRGRQVSFYVPTFSKEMVLAANYTSGDAAIVITNIGYAKYAQQRQPRGDLRITLTSGVVFTRQVTSSSDGGATESLTLSSSIGQNITLAQVARIDYLSKTRIDDDEIIITHNDANGSADIGFPVKDVTE